MHYIVPCTRTSQGIIYGSSPKRILHLLGGTSRQRESILTDLKSDRDINGIIVVGFTTPLSSIDRTYRQKINKEILDLNTFYIKNQTDIYRTWYPTVAEHTFFSSAHGMFSIIDYMLGH